MLRVFVLVLGLVLFIPAIGYMVWYGLQQVPEVAKLTDDFAQTAGGIVKGVEKIRIAGSNASVSYGEGGGPDPSSVAQGAGWRKVRAAHQNKREFDAFVSHEAFDRRRMVRFIIPVTPEEMLAEGEALPDPFWRRSFLEARAVQVAAAQCALLPQSFARDCKLRDFDLRHRGPGGQVPMLEVALNYIEATPLGVLPLPESDPRIVREQVQIEGLLVTREGMPEALAQVFDAAQKHCATLRAQSGNCAIEGVTIKDPALDTMQVIEVGGQMQVSAEANKGIGTYTVSRMLSAVDLALMRAE